MLPMILAVILLSAACLTLGLWVYTMSRSLRGAARQLRRLEEDDSAVRIRLSAPNGAAEELIAAVNGLLELRQADRADYLGREQALRQQIANISHDLRTPLTSILGYLQLLEDEKLSPQERREYMDIVESRAKALQSLITSFYDLSRMEGGEYPLTLETVDLNGALSGPLADFYNDLEGAGLDVKVELEEGLPQVIADPAAAARIFTNLIRNAMDHGKGSLEIRQFLREGLIVTRFENEAGDLKEEDTGRVFERFFTSDRTRSGGNAGLGLSIVKSLAQRMGCQTRAGIAGGRFYIEILWKPQRGSGKL